MCGITCRDGSFITVHSKETTKELLLTVSGYGDIEMLSFT